MNKYKLEIAIPAVSDGKLNGLIGLGKKDNLQSYTIEDIELLEQMGVQLGVVIENALHHEDILDKQRLQNEMKIAERIQMALIPPIPHNKELEITAITHPAEEVGGDYYDILEDHKQNIWFAIGDVTGHGLTPGLIMMMAQSSFSTILGREGDISPSGALSEVNAVLYKNIVDRLRENHNMTMQFVKYSGNGRFIFSNAGHPDAIIFRNRTRTLEFISNPSSFLGLFPDISDGIIETEFILDQDDILLLYTDGITESKDSHNALWGEERFNETVVQSGQMSLEAMRDIIMEASLAWCHHHAHDDMTLLLVKRK